MAKIWPFRGNDSDNYGYYVNMNNYLNCIRCSNCDLQLIGIFCGIIIIYCCSLFGPLYFDICILNYRERHSMTFQVDFLEVNSMTFPPPDALLSLNFTVINKAAKLFNNLQATIEYDRHIVSTTTIAPFHQDALSVKTIPVFMGMADTRLPDKVIDSIRKKLGSGGVLDFTVIVHGVTWNIDYDKKGRRRGYTCDMKMVCKGVKVTLSSTKNTWNGSTKDGPFRCKYSSNGCYY